MRPSFTALSLGFLVASGGRISSRRCKVPRASSLFPVCQAAPLAPPVSLRRFADLLMPLQRAASRNASPCYVARVLSLAMDLQAATQDRSTACAFPSNNGGFKKEQPRRPAPHVKDVGHSLGQKWWRPSTASRSRFQHPSEVMRLATLHRPRTNAPKHT